MLLQLYNDQEVNGSCKLQRDDVGGWEPEACANLESF